MDAASLEFLKAAARRPRDVATVFPTARPLAERLARAIADAPGQVVELGAGTGAITRVVAPRVPGRLTALEIDPEMVRFLRAQFPDVRVVCAPAQELGSIVPAGAAGAVVASLPWTLLSTLTLERVLVAARGALAPGGVFATYLCLHARANPRARLVLGRMRAHFAFVEEAPIAWRNVPPAVPIVARVL